MAKKKHPEKQLKDCAITLLYYCARNNKWESIDLNDAPYLNFLSALSEYPPVSSVFGGDIADHIVTHALKTFSAKDKEEFLDSDAQNFIELAIETLKMNVETCWMFISLKNAVLTKTVDMGNIVLIAGSKVEKLDFIANLSDISRDELERRAAHTERSRDPEFYSSPLIGIKVNHQFDRVLDQAKIYGLWVVSIIYAIYWGFVYPNNEPHQFMNIRASGSSNVDRSFAVVLGQRNWGHYPFGIKLRCDLHLDWLAQTEYQERLLNLLSNIVEQRNSDELRMRFFKGFRFFIKAIYSEYNRDPFDGVELTLLYFVVIVEGLLLDRDSEKRSRLTVLLSRLAEIPETTLSERAQAVEKAYRWRSEFVHAGKETYLEDWTENFSEGETHQNIELLKRMTAKLLCDSPQHIANMQAQSNEQTKLESQWFRHLRSEWNKVLGLQD